MLNQNLVQKIIGLVADGGIRPNTLGTLNEYIRHNGLAITNQKYKNVLQAFYESLSIFNTFGKGWTRRNNETLDAGLKML